MKKTIITASLFILLFAAACSVNEVTWQDVIQWQDQGRENIVIIDVRTQEEYNAGHVPGALLIPYTEITSSTDEFSSADKIILYCRSGRRAGIAQDALEEIGDWEVYNLGSAFTWPGELVE
ncbi:MAG: rhodanese-like domain-containing protein [Spirochaetia bacterium]